VEIKSQKPEIADKLAKVVAVNEVTVDVLLRNTQTMEMVKHRLRLEEVEPVALDKEPRVKALSQRLSQLQALVSEPFEIELIDLLGQRVALTPVEEDYLTKMEQKYFYFA
jgi:predicted nuclease with TOPRIM domain